MRMAASTRAVYEPLAKQLQAQRAALKTSSRATLHVDRRRRGDRAPPSERAHHDEAVLPKDGRAQHMLEEREGESGNKSNDVFNSLSSACSPRAAQVHELQRLLARGLMARLRRAKNRSRLLLSLLPGRR